MNGVIDSRLTRIGVFYDGTHFNKVSNYYGYVHDRKARLSIEGLHAFMRQQVAKEESVDARYCQIVDAHYFRGRISGAMAQEQHKLLDERNWDDVLMKLGVVTHYLPVVRRGSEIEEKGIDVWLALETFELAILKRFNVCVLVAGDGDYVPLIRKLNTLGTRVMLLVWDEISYQDEKGRAVTILTADTLQREATYAPDMVEQIDGVRTRHSPEISALFLPRKDYLPERRPSYPSRQPVRVGFKVGEHEKGRITGGLRRDKNNKGYGFIMVDVKGTIFFHSSELEGGEQAFSSLQDGDLLEFSVGDGSKGFAARKVKPIQEGEGGESAVNQSAISSEPVTKEAGEGENS